MGVETADVIVIGLGAVGAATLHRLSLRGVRVTGIDQFHPPHDRGSSHGESRITRLAVGEGEAYAPLVRRSHDIWRELEAATGETLFLQNGGLILGPRDGVTQHHGKDNFIARTIGVAQAFGIAHEVLDAAEVGRRFPQFLLRGDEIGFFEPSAGMVFPERCVDVQLRLAADNGATLHLGETVTGISETKDGVTVATNQRTLHAGRAVLAAGPWLPGMLDGPIKQFVQVYRQTLHWFDAEDPAMYAPERFPVFIWLHGRSPEDYFYGFPAQAGANGIKVATERYAFEVSPETIERSVLPSESAEIFQHHVSGRLRGIRASCPRTAACMYSVTPDAGFLVDTLSSHGGIFMVSACSGHGFKHSAALGEILADHATSSVSDKLAAFSARRYLQTAK
jgi:sarcosine oxidase